MAGKTGQKDKGKGITVSLEDPKGKGKRKKRTYNRRTSAQLIEEYEDKINKAQERTDKIREEYTEKIERLKERHGNRIEIDRLVTEKTEEELQEMLRAAAEQQKLAKLALKQKKPVSSTK